MEGSLRQAGSTLRIAAQLVDASSGAHLWAETYNRPFRSEEIFELQDDLVNPGIQRLIRPSGARSVGSRFGS